MWQTQVTKTLSTPSVAAPCTPSLNSHFALSMNTKLIVLGVSTLFAMLAHAQSSNALIVLTTVGYLTGAADACKVAADDSNALSSGLSLAISKGQYGDQANAHVLFNNAKQEGISQVRANKLNCQKVGELVREQVRSLRASAKAKP